MPYANEVALDECHKRGIDVMFGWKMIKVHMSDIVEKIATFKNVYTGERSMKNHFSMQSLIQRVILIKLL